ncbi:MAG: hypothetical protein IPO67_02335 [Deltaproteobacteria bacterium]|nr:hypothetical protein [Deltaproteobacteria bacterium]
MRLMTLVSLSIVFTACNGEDKDAVEDTQIAVGNDEDGDGVTDDVDCDDGDAAVTTGPTWFVDADADGFGNPGYPLAACEAPAGYADNNTDCDDGEATVYPDAPESCDALDNDCDGAIDEELTLSWYADIDGDGFGDPAERYEGCLAPTDLYVAQGGDCDEGEPTIYPGAPTLCDGLDRDCDGLIDDDGDFDGYADATCGGDDCVDDDPTIFPEAGLCALGESCLDVLNEGRSTGDGEYTIDPDGAGTGASPLVVTCDMTTEGGGFTVLTDLNFSVDACPGEWLLDGSKPYCRRDSEVASAASASFPSFGVSWTELHTTLTAYQYASMNAFYYAEGRGLDDLYVDGLSITRGAEGSREHLYTFAIGMTTKGSSDYDCPAQGGNPPPDYVGEAYACGSANTTYGWIYAWYSSPVFSALSTLSAASAASTDDVELRLMADEESGTHNNSEDIGLSSLKVMVR